jgi:type I restriction enzyme S subunit
VNRPRVTIDQIKAKTRFSLVGGPFGSNLVTSDYQEYGVPVIRGGNIPGDKAFSYDDLVFVSEEKADRLLPNNAFPGDLVVTQRGTLGQVGLIPSDSPYPRFVISQSQMKLTVDPQIASAKFVYYYFCLPESVQRVKNQAITSGVPHINLEILKRFELTLPPLQEQRRIAAILSAYDDLIENNQRRIQLLEQAAQLIYWEWFVRLRFPGHERVRVVDGVPEGWKRVTMADICQALGGGTPDTKNPAYWDNGEITWVIPSDITKNNCLVILDSERKITEAGLRNSSAKLLPPDTILMTSRASVGFFGLIDREVCTNQGFIAAIPNAEILRMYLLFNLLSRRDEILQNAKGTTYLEINKATFRRMPIIVPSDTVLDEFQTQASRLIRQVRLLKRQTEKLKRARDLLLPRLMSGQIEV